MSKHRRMWRIGLAVVMTVTGAVAFPAAYATSDAEASVRQDFNGDGYEDLAVAARDGTVNGKAGAGYVAVLYGSARGLRADAKKKVYSQASAGVPGTPEKRDAFGSGLVAADLDGDGFTDLVVQSNYERWKYGGIARTGSRTVLWGNSTGLASGTVLPFAGNGEYLLGKPLTGDFDGDGQQDLYQLGGVGFGPFGRDGRPASAQDDVELVVDEEQMMFDVAAGDADGDGITDIVAHVAEGESDSDSDYHNYVNYVRGSRDGLQKPTVLKDAQGRPRETGGTLALGDLNGDRRADLVVGYPSIQVFPGTANGLSTDSPVVIDQDTPGVPGTQEPVDSFGSELSIGDVDGDGYEDVLVGITGEAVGSVYHAGSFAVVPGGPSGPTGTGTRVFTQNSAGVPGTAEKNDCFGCGLHLVDADGDGRAEPVVGAPGENDNAGAVWVFRATSDGVTAKGSFSFGARTLGMAAANGVLGFSFPN